MEESTPLSNSWHCWYVEGPSICISSPVSGEQGVPFHSSNAHVEFGGLASTSEEDSDIHHRLRYKYVHTMMTVDSLNSSGWTLRPYQHGCQQK